MPQQQRYAFKDNYPVHHFKGQLGVPLTVYPTGIYCVQPWDSWDNLPINTHVL